MLSDVHVCVCVCVCVCERMHPSQCFWLYLNKVSLCLLDHQDQASTPEGQSPPAFPLVVGRKLSSVCAPLSTLILIPPSFHVWWGKRCWNTEDYQHSEPVSSLRLTLALPADTCAAFRPEETESIRDSSGLSLGSWIPPNLYALTACLTNNTCTNGHTLVHTQRINAFHMTWPWTNVLISCLALIICLSPQY